MTHIFPSCVDNFSRQRMPTNTRKQIINVTTIFKSHRFGNTLVTLIVEPAFSCFFYFYFDWIFETLLFFVVILIWFVGFVAALSFSCCFLCASCYWSFVVVVFSSFLNSMISLAPLHLSYVSFVFDRPVSCHLIFSFTFFAYIYFTMAIIIIIWFIEKPNHYYHLGSDFRTHTQIQTVRNSLKLCNIRSNCDFFFLFLIYLPHVASSLRLWIGLSHLLCHWIFAVSFLSSSFSLIRSDFVPLTLTVHCSLLSVPLPSVCTNIHSILMYDDILISSPFLHLCLVAVSSSSVIVRHFQQQQ